MGVFQTIGECLIILNHIFIKNTIKPKRRFTGNKKRTRRKY